MLQQQHSMQFARCGVALATSAAGSICRYGTGATVYWLSLVASWDSNKTVKDNCAASACHFGHGEMHQTTAFCDDMNCFVDCTMCARHDACLAALGAAAAANGNMQSAVVVNRHRVNQHCNCQSSILTTSSTLLPLVCCMTSRGQICPRPRHTVARGCRCCLSYIYIS